MFRKNIFYLFPCRENSDVNAHADVAWQVVQRRGGVSFRYRFEHFRLVVQGFYIAHCALHDLILEIVWGIGFNNEGIGIQPDLELARAHFPSVEFMARGCRIRAGLAKSGKRGLVFLPWQRILNRSEFAVVCG